MVVVEGVARKLDPHLNMWATAEPVVGEWIADNLGPRARIEDVGRGLSMLVKLIGEAPPRLERLARWIDAGGLERDARLIAANARTTERSVKFAFWIIAASLACIAAYLALHA
jgi:ubiquinone biosynthesis protein